MLFPKFVAIGVASLALLHPAVKYLDFNWEQEALDAREHNIDEEMNMSSHVYQNGVLFGLWVAGVAISMGRLFTYAVYGGSKGVDAQTQTETETEQEGQSIEEEHKKETEVINQESYTKLPATPEPEPEEKTVKVEDVGTIEEDDVTNNDEEPSIEDVVKVEEKTEQEKEEEGSKVDPECEEKDEKMEIKTKISVYKLPAIKRHHFMILQDGMRVLRQAVQGDFSLEKVTLDGIRNFIFLVAKGSPSQLSDLESKIKSDFRWLTPVREPHSKLTGGIASQEPIRMVTTVHESSPSRIPTKTTNRKSTPPGLRQGVKHSTPFKTY